LVDPPLEGEAAVLLGDRVWVAGAGPEGALWLYAFAFAEGRLTALERLRLPADAGARVARLRASADALILETRSARDERAWSLRRS
jgi:hypothetical protein